MPLATITIMIAIMLIHEALKLAGSSYVNHLLDFKYQLPPKYALEAGMRITQLRKVLDAVATANGDDLQKLPRDGDNLIDLAAVQCYSFAALADSGEAEVGGARL